MSRKFVFAAGAALFVMSGAALAQQPEPVGGERGASVTRDQVVARVDQRFARLDANGDGRVTADEARESRQVRRAERQGQLFDRLDANRDGQISREEFGQRQALRAERRAERGERRGWRAERRAHRDDRRGMRAQRRAMRLFGQDGVITREEFRQRALQRFERLDANRDCTVTAEERRAAREQMRGERRTRLMERRSQD